MFAPRTAVFSAFCHATVTTDRKDFIINTLTSSALITREDVVAAAKRIEKNVQHTPLIESEVAGTPIWLKCECLQTGGAFKLRGATNRLLQLSFAGTGAARGSWPSRRATTRAESRSQRAGSA